MKKFLTEFFRNHKNLTSFLVAILLIVLVIGSILSHIFFSGIIVASVFYVVWYMIHETIYY